MKRKRMSIRHVLVAIDLSGAAGRELYSGISGFAKDNCHWSMELVSHAERATRETFASLLGSGIDGIITSETDAPGYRYLREQADLPTVVIGYPDSKPDPHVCFLRNDDVDVGRLAAKYLSSLGNFRTFSFMPCESRAYWSLLREKGFKEFLRAQRLYDRYRRFPPLDGLQTWLKGVAKPVAIMSAYDLSATKLITVCHQAKVKIPQQVAIIGVDDDRLLCDFSDPPLSSIRPDHEREGAMSAEVLERLMDGRPPKENQIIVRNSKIIERETTVALSPSAHLVQNGLAYIQNNLKRPPTVESVVAHLHVSRRLADLRFTEITGKTVAETISQERLKSVENLLRTTQRPISSIAAACAFANANHLANAFRRHYGMSMSDYRNQGAS